uniref:Uncharacterized protein n=1 Tax=Branchiostoma floridae TaxID=7739 RepID=C3XPG6_BRAFL|eukprot:XP_002613828.1 hypothetical protein BRAFLDRAFT_119902 [Branchiostoma floridae]
MKTTVIAAAALCLLATTFAAPTGKHEGIDQEGNGDSATLKQVVKRSAPIYFFKRTPLDPIENGQYKRWLKRDPLSPIVNGQGKRDPLSPIVNGQGKRDPLSPISNGQGKRDPLSPIVNGQGKRDPLSPIVNGQGKRDPLKSHRQRARQTNPLSPIVNGQGKRDPLSPIVNGQGKRDPLSPITNGQGKRDPLSPISNGQGKRDPLSPISNGQGKRDPLSPISNGQGKRDPLSPIVNGQGKRLYPTGLERRRQYDCSYNEPNCDVTAGNGFPGKRSSPLDPMENGQFKRWPLLSPIENGQLKRLAFPNPEYIQRSSSDEAEALETDAYDSAINMQVEEEEAAEGSDEDLKCTWDVSDPICFGKKKRGVLSPIENGGYQKRDEMTSDQTTNSDKGPRRME